MKELIEFTFEITNIIPTILLIFVLLYWLSVFIGLLDLHFLDFDVNGKDLHIEKDFNFDKHVDINKDISIHDNEPGFLISVLSFFNLGKVPFMIFMSILTIFTWTTTLLTNYYLHINTFFISFLVLIPIFITNLFITKIITNPLANMFEKIEGRTKEDESLIGRTGTIVISVDDNSLGQIEIIGDSGTTVKLSVICREGEIEKGKQAIILDFDDERKAYIVEFYDFDKILNN